MGQTKNRISYISQAQLIGCLLVILGHSIPLSWQIPNSIYVADTFLYTFHMPMFFFISGYLFVKTNSLERYSFSAYMIKRAKRLLIPYFVMTFIGFFPKLLLNSYFNNDTEFSINYILKAIFMPRENVWGHLWFLPTLLIISMFSFVFATIKKHSKPSFAVVTAALFVLSMLPKPTDWLGINDIIKFICYYALGMLFADTKAEEFICSKKKAWLLALFPIAVVLYAVPVKISILSGVRDKIVGIMMLVFVLVVSLFFDITDSKIGAFLTRKTYSIYILAWPFQAVAGIVVEQKLMLKYYITMPVVFLFGVGGATVTILIVDAVEKRLDKRIFSPIIGG